MAMSRKLGGRLVGNRKRKDRRRIHHSWHSHCSATSFHQGKEALHLVGWSEVQGWLSEAARTPMGQRAAKEYSPASAREETANLLEETEAVSRLSFPFEGVRDVEEALKAMEVEREREHLPGVVLLELASTLEATRAVGKEAAKEPSLKRQADEALGIDEGLYRPIQESLESPGGRVKDDASAELSRARQERRRAREEAENLLNDISQKLVSLGAAERGSQGPVERQGRLCLPVRRDRQDLLQDGIVLDESGRGGTLYIEPSEVVDLNNAIEGFAQEERDEVTRILSALTDALVQELRAVRRGLSALVRIDLASARAIIAGWMDAKKPSLLEGKPGHFVLEKALNPILLSKALPSLPIAPVQRGVTPGLKKGEITMDDILSQYDQEQFLGRHGEGNTPEQGLATLKPTPIDFEPPNGTRAVAITGPNAGGKTAALKTIGLMAFMAKAGMFVPADRAEMSWPDEILADIGDPQELEMGLSTFSGHVQRLKWIVESVHEGAIVLLDEPGSGTDPVEGAALACSILETLAEKSSLTITTSHYDEVKQLGINGSDLFANCAVELDAQTLLPTYQLSWYRSGSSSAFDIAYRLGMPPRVISGAREILPSMTAGPKELEATLEAEKALADTMAEEALSQDELHFELQSRVEELSTIHHESLAEKEESYSDIERQAKDRIREAANHELDDHPEQYIYEAIEWARNKLSIDSDTANGGEAWVSLSPGDNVRVISLDNAIGEVLRSPTSDGKVEVQAGRMKFWVSMREVSPAGEALRGTEDRQMKSEVRPDFPLDGNPDFPSVPSEQNTVDVRGRPPEDAARAAREAFDARHKVLYIIHGKGHGSLRAAVREMVARHPDVLQFRPGESSEGGEGVTVVRLAQ